MNQYLNILLIASLCFITANSESLALCNYCNVQPEYGPCDGEIEKFFFNSESNNCESFIWSGCSSFGIQNRFDSLAECEASECKQNGSISEPECPRCRLQTKTGPCRAAIPRYYYNINTKSCELFSWGGCQPNGNNFETFAECVASECIVRLNFDCIPREGGICLADFRPRYIFNETSRQCEINQGSSGCEVFENIFLEKDACEDKCVLEPFDDCTPRIDGACIASWRNRYVFNAETGQCEVQNLIASCEIYENVFTSLAECEGRCVPRPVDDCDSDSSSSSSSSVSSISSSSSSSSSSYHSYSSSSSSHSYSSSSSSHSYSSSSSSHSYSSSSSSHSYLSSSSSSHSSSSHSYNGYY